MNNNGTVVYGCPFITPSKVADQTYNPKSTNAQSGKAVAEAVEYKANVEKESFYSGAYSMLNGSEVNGMYTLTIVGTAVDNYIAVQFEPIDSENQNRCFTFKLLNADVSSINRYKKFIGCRHLIELEPDDKFVHIFTYKDGACKQDKLIAGDNITIDENNVISATGGGSADTVINNLSASLGDNILTSEDWTLAEVCYVVIPKTKKINGVNQTIYVATSTIFEPVGKNVTESKETQDIYYPDEETTFKDYLYVYNEYDTNGELIKTTYYCKVNSADHKTATGTASWQWDSTNKKLTFNKVASGMLPFETVSAISIPIGTSDTIIDTGTNYYLVSFNASPKLEMDVVTVSIGGSQTYDLYHGTTGASDVYYCGVKSEIDGDLVISAVKDWSGTISSITVKQIITPLTAEHIITDINGNTLDEHRYNRLNLQNIWHGYKTGEMNVEGYGNVGLGYEALKNNTSGFWNVAIGRLAMNDNTVGSRNIAIGQQSLSKHKSGLRNVAIGSFALSQMTDGVRNIAIGADAMKDANNGRENIGIGYCALNGLKGGTVISGIEGGMRNVAIGDHTLSIATGSYNFALGAYAQQNNLSGSKNIAIGNQALKGNAGGGSNVAIGHNSMSNSSGNYCSRNICIGESSGDKLSGQNNICIGHSAGSKLTSGIGNILIGYMIGGTTTDANTHYQLNIGGIISGCIGGTIGTTTYDKLVKINAPLELDFASIPTSDPNIKGKVWNDNGTLKISTGA